MCRSPLAPALRSGYRDRGRDKERSGSRDVEDRYARPGYDRPPYERPGLDRVGSERYSSPFSTSTRLLLPVKRSQICHRKFKDLMEISELQIISRSGQKRVSRGPRASPCSTPCTTTATCTCESWEEAWNEEYWWYPQSTWKNVSTWEGNICFLLF